MSMDSKSRDTILLCGTGSIASINLPGCAYELATQTKRSVHVVVTQNALQFTTRRALQAMSGHPVWVDEFADETPDGVAPHVRLTDTSLMVVVYPATANFIAKISQGLADDLATAVVLCADCPVLVVPTMHNRMWNNPATQDNVARLERRGVIVLRPSLSASAKESVENVTFSVSQVAEASRRILSNHYSFGAKRKRISEI